MLWNFPNWILVSYYIPFYAHKAGRQMQRLTLHGYWREVLLSAKHRHVNTKVLETPPFELTSWLGLITKLSPSIPQTRWIGVPTIRCLAVITLNLSLSISQSMHSYYLKNFRGYWFCCGSVHDLFYYIKQCSKRTSSLHCYIFPTNLGTVPHLVGGTPH